MIICLCSVNIEKLTKEERIIYEQSKKNNTNIFFSVPNLSTAQISTLLKQPKINISSLQKPSLLKLNTRKFKSRKKIHTIESGIDYKTFSISCELNANFGHAFRLHIVMIYDEQQNDMLKSTAAFEYFQRCSVLKNENSVSLRIYEICLIPGKTHEEFRVPIINNGLILVNTIVFADLMMKDVPSTPIRSFIKSNEVIRKAIVGNLPHIKLNINRAGIFQIVSK